MPGSSIYGKALICLTKSYSKPLRLFDVGIGAGAYWALMHEMFPDCVLNGVEAWEPYLDRFDLESKYSKVIVADLIALDWSAVPEFDIVFSAMS